MLNVDVAIQKLAAMIAPLSSTEVVDVADSVGRTAARAGDNTNLTAAFRQFGNGRLRNSVQRHRRGRPPVRIKSWAQARQGIRSMKLCEPENAYEFSPAPLCLKAQRLWFCRKMSIERAIASNSKSRPPQATTFAMPDWTSPPDQTLVDSGTIISPFARGWFAACGITKVEVTRRVRVALFSTGDELVEAGRNLEHGQIYDSNRESLKALVDRSAVEIQDLGCLPDDFDETKETLDQTAKKADVIVTSGGVSVGDSDFVRPAVEALGSLEFWNIALKPGKPLAVGRVRRRACSLAYPATQSRRSSLTCCS